MKLSRALSIIVAVSMLFLSSICVESAEYKDTRANISFEIDDSWSVSSRTPLTLVSPDGGTVMILEVVKASSLDDALDDAEVFLGKNLSNITMTPRKDMLINGIPSAEVEGKCTMNGIPANYRLLVLAASKDCYTYLYYFGAPGHEKANKDTISKFAGSIKRIRQK